MSNRNIVIAGFGGQGVLFIGRVLATAGLIDGKEVSWLPSYGPEMRGGTANCSVCLSDKPIGSPLVTEPDILVAMNGPSFDKFVSVLAPGATVFTDKSLMPDTVLPAGKDATLYSVPATQLSSDEGLQSLANMILLGKVIKETELATMETIEKALRLVIPERNAHLLEPNLRAISLGMSL